MFEQQVTPQPGISAARQLETLEAEICELAGHLAAATGKFLILLAEFDARRGWASWDMPSCAAWLSWKCQLSSGTAREHVRVARALRALPAIRGARRVRTRREIDRRFLIPGDRAVPADPAGRITPVTSAPPTPWAASSVAPPKIDVALPTTGGGLCHIDLGNDAERGACGPLPRCRRRLFGNSRRWRARTAAHGHAPAYVRALTSARPARPPAQALPSSSRAPRPGPARPDDHET